jgi:hypothetical protein
MSTSKLTLVLAELEAEVLQEALDLYVRARPVPVDHRFEYRYRAARSVLDSLRLGTNRGVAIPAGDDEDAGEQAPDRRDGRTRREWAED